MIEKHDFFEKEKFDKRSLLYLTAMFGYDEGREGGILLGNAKEIPPHLQKKSTAHINYGLEWPFLH